MCGEPGAQAPALFARLARIAGRGIERSSLPSPCPSPSGRGDDVATVVQASPLPSASACGCGHFKVAGSPRRAAASASGCGHSQVASSPRRAGGERDRVRGCAHCSLHCPLQPSLSPVSGESASIISSASARAASHSAASIRFIAGCRASPDAIACCARDSAAGMPPAPMAATSAAARQRPRFRPRARRGSPCSVPQQTGEIFGLAARRAGGDPRRKNVCAGSGGRSGGEAPLSQRMADAGQEAFARRDECGGLAGRFEAFAQDERDGRRLVLHGLRLDQRKAGHEDRRFLLQLLNKRRPRRSGRRWPQRLAEEGGTF